MRFCGSFRWAAVCAVVAHLALNVGGLRAEEMRGERGPAIIPPINPSAAAIAIPDFPWSTEANLRLAALSAIELPDFNDEVDTPGAPLQVGVHRELGVRPITSAIDGMWQIGEAGGVQWEMQIESPGAKGLRLHFSKLEIPHGAVLTVAGNLDAVPFAVTAEEAGGGGARWGDVTAGEKVFIRYFDPSGQTPGSVIEVDSVSHLYREVNSGEELGTSDPEDSATPAVLPCHQDVNCHNVDAVARDAVGRMLYTTSQGSFVCTGTLLNDADPNTSAGYFLTAHHCIDSQAKADTLVVSWFYQSNYCGGPVAGVATKPKSSGAKLLVGSATTDFALLRLNDDPNQGQGFAGFTTEPPIGEVTAIHHPGGSYKRYSSGVLTTEPPTCSDQPSSRYFYNDWTVGVTEGGSSGSPLFNGAWQIVGQRFGVCKFQEPDCSNPDQYNNVYGKFANSYSEIERYLGSIAEDDVYENADSTSAAAPLSLGTHVLRLVDFDDFYAVQFDAPTVLKAEARFVPAQMDLNLYLLDEGGQVIASSTRAASTTAGGKEFFERSVSAGTYYLRAHKLHGWGGDYLLELSAAISSCPAPGEIKPEVKPVAKNRYLSVVPPNGSGRTALRVTLRSLHHPDPLYENPAGTFEMDSSEGDVRWVGPWNIQTDSVSFATEFAAAALQCEPFYTDWSQAGELHIYGTEIVPSSVYEIQAISEYCSRGNEGNYSTPLSVATGRWGDVVAPFQPPHPAPLNQPNVSDIAAVVDRFKDLPGSVMRPVSSFQPALLDPQGPVNIRDIAAVVDAFRGYGYLFAGPAPCR